MRQIQMDYDSANTFLSRIKTTKKVGQYVEILYGGESLNSLSCIGLCIKFDNYDFNSFGTLFKAGVGIGDEDAVIKSISDIIKNSHDYNKPLNIPDHELNKLIATFRSADLLENKFSETTSTIVFYSVDYKYFIKTVTTDRSMLGVTTFDILSLFGGIDPTNQASILEALDSLID